MTHAHDFLAIGDGAYQLEVPDLGIVLTVNRLRRRSDELIGELTVTCDLPGAQRVSDEGVIVAADVNLSSVRARQDRAALLAKRAQTGDGFDWFATLEYFCQHVITAERVGQPATLLRDVPKPSPDTAWTIHRLPVLKDQPMVLFGDGGSGKSLLALSIAGELAARGVPTLYADWETSAGDHRDRLEQLFGAARMPPVHYARCEWPMAHEADRLRRLVQAHDLQYVVLDSVAFGCDGPPEAAESAAAYFRAIRRLRVGALAVAHITKSESGDQRPFGSAFWHNGARATWFVKRSDADGDAGSMTLALFNRKANTGPLLSPRGLRVSFSDGRIGITSTDLADSEQFAPGLPLWQRMKRALAHGPLPLAALAEELDAKPDSLKKIVDRSKSRPDPMFTRIVGDDGQTRISLVERRSA